MASTVQESAQEMVKSYSDMVFKSLVAAESGWEQATAAISTFADASQAEAEKAGRLWEEMVEHAQGRTMKLAELAKDAADIPAAGMTPEAAERVKQFIDGETAFYKTWTGYVTGLEQRRGQLMAGLLEDNTRMMEAGQELAKSAFDFGVAALEWSLALTREKPAPGAE